MVRVVEHAVASLYSEVSRMTYQCLILRVIAMAFGLALVAAQVMSNLDYMGNVSVFTGIGIAAVALPLSMAVVVAVQEHLLVERRYGLATVALVVLVCGVGHTFVTALERGVAIRETTAAARAQPNAARDLARQALDDARARVTRLEAAEAGACRTVSKTGAYSRECVAARGQTTEARALVTRSQSDLAAIGVGVDTNGLAKRYGGFADVVDLVQPFLLPMAMELGGLVLIGFALSGARSQRRVVMPEPLGKEAAAVERIHALREQLGRIPRHREVVEVLQIPAATASRARRKAIGRR